VKKLSRPRRRQDAQFFTVDLSPAQRSVPEFERAHIQAVKTIPSDAVSSAVFSERELSTINLTHDTRRAELI